MGRVPEEGGAQCGALRQQSRHQVHEVLPHRAQVPQCRPGKHDPLFSATVFAVLNAKKVFVKVLVIVLDNWI